MEKKDYALYFSQSSDVLMLSSMYINQSLNILEQEHSVNAM